MELNKVNYKKNVKPYEYHKPYKAGKGWGGFAHLLFKLGWKKNIKKIEKIDMDGVRAPYVLISNHQTFTDFAVNTMAIYPDHFGAIATFEGHMGFPKSLRPWALKHAGCIPKRKFTTDAQLIDDCKTVLDEYKNVLILYPEARYTDIGTTSYIHESYGQLLKMLDHPVVAIVQKGSYLREPFWNWQKKRKVKTVATMKKILDVEDLRRMTPDEILEVVRRELNHDEYKYQKENNIIIKEKFRAEGLNKALYQCPNCLTEFEMESKGTKLWCNHCGKEWEMSELGELRATVGDTEFTHIPDWYNWEHENVRKEVAEGKYSFEDDVDIYTLPNMKGFIHIGKGKIRHSREEGVVVEGHYNGEDFKIVRPSAGLYSIHTEYNYPHIIKKPCIHVSTKDDTFICYTTKKDVVTKVYFAVDSINKQIMKERAEKRANRLAKKSSEDANESSD